MLKEYLQIYRLSVVIIGNFNPVIIQPYWLAHKKLIRDQEAQDAKVEIIHPDLVKYSVDWADIEVRKERMEFSTTQEGLFESLKDLVISIFGVLRETPVKNFGINHIRYYLLPDSERYYYLGNKLASLSNFKGVLKDPRMANIEILQHSRYDDKPGIYHIKIRPSERQLSSPYGIAVDINDHFELGKNETAQNLIQVLSDSFNNSITTAEKVIAELWQNINI